MPKPMWTPRAEPKSDSGSRRNCANYHLNPACCVPKLLFCGEKPFVSATMSSKKIVTSLSQVVPSIRTPVVLGAMAGASGGDLAGAVSAAGGFGFIGAGYLTPPVLRSEIQKAFVKLDVAHSDLVANRRRAELGIGILVWRLTDMNKGRKPSSNPSETVEEPVLEFLKAIIEARPRAIWLSFGDKEELCGWQEVLARLDSEINGDLHDKADEALRWFIMIGREQELRMAVEECRCDVLIVQGSEAGGHGHSEAPPLSALLSDVLRQLHSLRPNNSTGTVPPVLGAGGLADGKSLASLLSAGCAGAVFGTRFVMTPESTYSETQKHALTAAKSSETQRTFAFDDARGTLGWPKGTDGRGLRNLTVQEYEQSLKARDTPSDSAESAAHERRERYKLAAQENDTDRIVIWAGTGIGAITHITPAAQVVNDITAEAVRAIQTAHSYIK